MLSFGSLFAGIGGFDLGFERAGMRCEWQVENDEFCRRVLEKHWPNVPRHGDIRSCIGLPTVDVICGGFPCQPFSLNGDRRGKHDDRFLWPEMVRIVAEVEPSWVVGENVPGIIQIQLDDCLSDLESLGYATWTCVLPACAFDAPHRRDRVFIVAHLEGEGLQAAGGRSGETPQLPRPTNQTRWAREPDVDRVVYGLPHRMDRVKALGNAVVPAVAEWIGRMIVEVEGGGLSS
jgi:DNA (cytosine-5)-methyltransferase 1